MEPSLELKEASLVNKDMNCKLHTQKPTKSFNA